MLTRRDFLKRMAALGLLLPSTRTIIDMGANLYREPGWADPAIFRATWGRYAANYYNQEGNPLFTMIYKAPSFVGKITTLDVSK